MRKLFGEIADYLAYKSRKGDNKGALAFDIDGVFTPDLIFPSDLGTDDVLSSRDLQKPLFTIPPGVEWYAITGRPVQDKEQTFSWFEKHFKNPPAKIFMNEGSWDSPTKSKIKALRMLVDVYGGVLFFESDPEQQLLYNKVYGVDCVHFESLIHGAIRHYIRSFS